MPPESEALEHAESSTPRSAPIYRNVAPAMTFEVHAVSGRARYSTMQLPHFTAELPMFMPVGTMVSRNAPPGPLRRGRRRESFELPPQGTVKGLTSQQLQDIGCHVILGNTYHLENRPGSQVVSGRVCTAVGRGLAPPIPQTLNAAGCRLWGAARLHRLAQGNAHGQRGLPDGETRSPDPPNKRQLFERIKKKICTTKTRCMGGFDLCTDARALRSLCCISRISQRRASRSSPRWTALGCSSPPSTRSRSRTA